ncbi:hypothetical protein RRG08_008740 [Elysia crispata]|uniref:Uncharacterized protein n=1 Tax=Elysia crispata TaxID=231223 RepID=A0AAE0YUL0_9GAST|nr:hypothetical protein RRG08_008740 [Elysia crispata]
MIIRVYPYMGKYFDFQHSTSFRQLGQLKQTVKLSPLASGDGTSLRYSSTVSEYTRLISFLIQAMNSSGRHQNPLQTSVTSF